MKKLYSTAILISDIFVKVHRVERIPHKWKDNLIWVMKYKFFWSIPDSENINYQYYMKVQMECWQIVSNIVLLIFDILHHHEFKPFYNEMEFDDTFVDIGSKNCRKFIKACYKCIQSKWRKILLPVAQMWLLHMEVFPSSPLLGFLLAVGISWQHSLVNDSLLMSKSSYFSYPF